MTVIQRYYKPSVELQFATSVSRGLGQTGRIPATESVPTISTDPLIVQSIGGIGLRVEFDVTRTDNPAPNRASVKIYNIDQAKIKVLEAAMATSLTPVAFAILIGYEGANSCIFHGEIRKLLPNERKEGNIITVIEADEGSIVDNVPVNTAIENPTPQVLLKEAVLAAAARGYTLVPHKSSLDITADPTFDYTTLEGAPDTVQYSLRALLNECARQCKAKWWIQNNMIYMRRASTRSPGIAAVLSEGSIISQSRRERGGQQIVSFADPGIEPGAYVLLPEGAPVRVTTTHHSGDTREANPWTCTFTTQGAL